MKIAACLIIGLVAAVSGCAVQGAPFSRATAPSGDATLYVYRPYHYESSLLRPPVTCGDDTARIGPGGYHVFFVAPGKVVCRIAGGETVDETEIDAVPGVYYIREEIGWGVLTGHPHLNPIDSDTAHDEIDSCCVLESNPAPSAENHTELTNS
jgi:hypothetical protein